MATVTLKKTVSLYGPDSAGILLTPRQFDRAEFVEGWRYELINGVLIMSPIPSLNERDPNQTLGYWLLHYQQTHPQGTALDFTIHEHTIRTGTNRRRADQVIWAGLGHLPRKQDLPTIVAEFVSPGKRNTERDYELKRDEYLAIRVEEYWVFNRFQHTLTVFKRRGNRWRKQVFSAEETYQTDLLPGFELPLKELFALADRWPTNE